MMKSKCLRAGQVRAYADSVCTYEISTDGEDETAVWEYCQKLERADVRDDKGTHDGHCGWPHGLSSYGSLHNIGQNLWRYDVTRPYDD